MLDAYTRKARLAPAMLAALPAISLLGTGIIAPAKVASALDVLTGGVGLLICGIVRDRGRALQDDLWREWGGPPPRQRLRWVDADSDAATVRLHERLDAILDHPLPTLREQQEDREDADRRYDEAVSELREMTRDGFPLVLAENIEYGFRRNALGIRPVALAVACICLVVSVALLIRSADIRFVVSAIVSLIAVPAWTRMVHSAWVRQAAERYTDRLFDSLASIARSAHS